jgi:HlyD family secretion protein
MTYLKVGALVALGLGLAACASHQDEVQGYVEGRYTYAAAYTSGYLHKLQVHRGENVRQGQPLFVLDKNPESDELAQAAANAAAEQETLRDMQLGERPSQIESIQQKIQAAAAQEAYSSKMYQRNTDLYAKQAVGKATLDQSKATYLHDAALVKELQDDLITAKLGARQHQQLAQAQRLKAALAGMKKAQWLLATKDYRAPKAGRVDETFYRQGEFVVAGQPVLSMLVPTEVKLIFYVPEPRLGSLQVGQRVHFRCDGCQPMTAKIDYIASKAEYTPPVLYTQDARKSLVYRVEAAIPAKVALQYHPGQPVDITLPKATGG